MKEFVQNFKLLIKKRLRINRGEYMEMQFSVVKLASSVSLNIQWNHVFTGLFYKFFESEDFLNISKK